MKRKILHSSFVAVAQSDQYEMHECGGRGLPPWSPDGIEVARVCQSCGEIEERARRDESFGGFWDAPKQGAD